MHCGRVPGAERRRRRSSWRGTGVEGDALLEHGMRVEQIQAILLTGVALSAAADGVVRALEADGRGHITPVARVPIVPAAVVFDLDPASGGVRPGPDNGEAGPRAATWTR